MQALLREGLREGVTASRALGYAQVLAALDAGGSAEQLRDAREQTYVGTRRYVRRQRSWFRRDHRVHWLDVGEGPTASCGCAAVVRGGVGRVAASTLNEDDLR